MIKAQKEVALTSLLRTLEMHANPIVEAIAQLKLGPIALNLGDVVRFASDECVTIDDQKMVRCVCIVGVTLKLSEAASAADQSAKEPSPSSSSRKSSVI